MRIAELPATQQMQIEQAFVAHQRGQVQQAGQMYNLLLREHPEQEDALFLMGVVAHQIGQSEQGQKLIQAALAIRPEIAEYTLLDGLLQQQGILNPASHLFNMYQQYRLFQQTDCFIISYPKCGRTWLRLLLGRALTQHFTPDGGEVMEIQKLTRQIGGIPVTEFSHDDYAHWKPAEAVVTDKGIYRDKKVVFLARDPRDALVSYFFQYTKRGSKDMANDGGFDGDISAFIRHRIGGIDSLIGFYNAWAAARDVPKDFLLISYEALQEDTFASLRKLCDFIGLEAIRDEVLTEAVAYCAFERMQQMEQKDTLGSHRLQAEDNQDPETYKVRKGKVGGYVDYLSAEDIAFVDRVIAERLDLLFSDYSISH